MADISWSAYALAMFTAEQLAAAAGAASTYEPPEPPTLLPPPSQPVTGLQVANPRTTAQLRAETGLDPNNAGDLGVLTEQGWHFVGGSWVKGIGASTTGGAGGGFKPGSASLQPSATTASSGTLLGYSIPQAAAVLLPQWVGGAIGVIREPGGYRPESGGTPLFQKPLGKVENWMRVEVPSGWGQ